MISAIGNISFSPVMRDEQTITNIILAIINIALIIITVIIITVIIIVLVAPVMTDELIPCETRSRSIRSQFP